MKEDNFVLSEKKIKKELDKFVEKGLLEEINGKYRDSKKVRVLLKKGFSRKEIRDRIAGEDLK